MSGGRPGSPIRKACSRRSGGPQLLNGCRLPARLGQPIKRKRFMSVTKTVWLASVAAAMVVMSVPVAAQQQQRVPMPQPQPQQRQQQQAQQRPPNILVIMGDDVGWFNIGAYHRGIMSGKTPNLDRLATEGMTFTDYYAEASCTAGRANFITGELPIRTGLTTVGQAGADVGIPAEAVTLATALKAQGYATGQFGK